MEYDNSMSLEGYTLMRDNINTKTKDAIKNNRFL